MSAKKETCLLRIKGKIVFLQQQGEGFKVEKVTPNDREKGLLRRRTAALRTNP